MSAPASSASRTKTSLVHRLRERGVFRVAASYAVIAWLLLQIASVVLDPFGIPKWVMTSLIIAAAAGFPLALALAWFLEIGDRGIELDSAPEGAVRPVTHGLRHYADAIVIAILLVAVVVLLVRQSDLGKPAPPAHPSIAVLPFANLSGDPDQEYFSDGLAEEMLDRLARVPGLKVIARSSSFGFKGRGVDAREVAKRLDVTTVLEGSVRRDGRRLKLNARLVDGATGQQVWSGSFDREVIDVFAVQAELASAVIGAIIPAARGDVVDKVAPPTSDLNAYDLYLLARTQLALRTPPSIQKSVELMEQAVALDPNFARAHAHLAASLLFARMFYIDNTAERAAYLRRAETSLHRALALDPDLSEAYDAQGNLLRDTGRPGAEDAYKRAIELNPNNAAAWHDYSVYLGNFPTREAEMEQATRRSLELDPRQPVTWANYLGDVLPQGRERFEAEYARALRTVGDMPGATFRFPHPIWATDRQGYRAELSKKIEAAGHKTDDLDALTLPVASIIGFPVEVLKAGLAKPQPQGDEAIPFAINHYRAWQVADFDRAATALELHPGARHRVNFDNVLLLLECELAGLKGDWDRLERVVTELRSRLGDDNPQLNSVVAFWATVRGRDEEASRALALAEPLQEFSVPPELGGDTHWGLMETAKVRIYRGSGRDAEARQLAGELLGKMRTEWRRTRGKCDWDGWMQAPMRYASLAANEGLKDEAVAALQTAMQCGDLPFGFWPQLPWFRSLEGYPPYDEVLRERARRIEQARTEMLQLENDARGAASAK